MKCPCGAAVLVDSVTPDFAGWLAHCVADHRLYLEDLDGVPVVLDDVEKRLA